MVWGGFSVSEHEIPESNEVARRAGDKAQWIMCLLCENRNLRWDPGAHRHTERR